MNNCTIPRNLLKDLLENTIECANSAQNGIIQGVNCAKNKRLSAITEQHLKEAAQIELKGE